VVSQWQSKTPTQIEQRSSERVRRYRDRRRRDALPFGAARIVDRLDIDACSASRRSLTSLHLSGSPTITGTMCVSLGITGRPAALRTDFYPRRAFLMAVALPLRSLEVPDRRGSGGADRPLLNRPLAMTFSSLLDCSKADLKVGDMHYRPHHT
jgi:hypothetical protein